MTRVELAGFADPVADAQHCFRAVLDAMARPGALRRAGQGLVAPAPLDPATAAVLLTLVDNETPLWLDTQWLQPVRDWIAFHCGAACIDDPGGAAFAACRRLPDFARLPAGSHESPESAATVILQVTSLDSGMRYALRGSGLAGVGVLTVDGLPSDFAVIWQANHARFPRGVDLVLCAGTQLTALPRSVTVSEA